MTSVSTDPTPVPSAASHAAAGDTLVAPPASTSTAHVGSPREPSNSTSKEAGESAADETTSSKTANAVQSTESSSESGSNPNGAAPLDTPPEPSPRLYVGNLPLKVKTQEIQDIFKDYAVAKVTIGRSKPNRNRQRSTTLYAFVAFDSTETATKALADINGKEYEERPLTVAFAKPEAPRKPKSSTPTAGGVKANSGTSETGTTEGLPTKPGKSAAGPARKPRVRKELPISEDTVYVSNLAEDETEENVRSWFAGFPNIEVSIVRKPSKKIRSKGKYTPVPPKTFAFVKVGSVDAQTRAVEQLDGKEVNGQALVVRRATVPASSVKSDSEDAAAAKEASTAGPEAI